VMIRGERCNEASPVKEKFSDLWAGIRAADF
jgi:hypothetical protein